MVRTNIIVDWANSLTWAQNRPPHNPGIRRLTTLLARYTWALGIGQLLGAAAAPLEGYLRFRCRIHVFYNV